MGIDMFLYVSDTPEIPDNYATTIMEDYDEARKIFPEVAYWRNANSIHNWFAGNIQGGVDNCEYSLVSPEHFKELLNVVNDVIQNPEKGPDLLPTVSGFFFGDTEYGEYYTQVLYYTKKVIERVLENYSDKYIFYHAYGNY